ncbi:MAG: SPOR domain-containing protein [Candidatus Omnitrophica bacterium]|nr:SPOR domain-containing protein [Candidatus Omnitrophota bacterium]
MKIKILIFLVIIIWVLFVFNIASYALNLERVKTHLLKGEYKSAILEGEKLLAGIQKDTNDLDELYYLLGLSYLKDGNYLHASDIFEIILKEFKESRYKGEALLGLADIFFLKGNFKEAEGYYQQILNNPRYIRFRALVYYRLSQIGAKTGDIEKIGDYLKRLEKEFPLSLELKMNSDLVIYRDNALDFYYTVQVGAFSNQINAQTLLERLIKEGYPAYIEEINLKESTSYRVRVGRFKTRYEAQRLEERLKQQGYPTKIYP